MNLLDEGQGAKMWAFHSNLARPCQTVTNAVHQTESRKRKVHAVRRHDGSLCTQKQPETQHA